MSSFKSSENIHKKEDGPDRSVSENQTSAAFAYDIKTKEQIYQLHGNQTADQRLCFRYTDSTSDFFHLFGNCTHTGSIGKYSVVFPPIGKKYHL